MPYNPDRINIHELTVEEPEKQEALPFDPENEITEVDRKMMLNNLEKLKKNGWWYDFGKLAAEIKIIDPDLDLGLDDDAWKKMLNEMSDTYKEKGDTWGIILKIGNMKVLNPPMPIEAIISTASGGAKDFQSIMGILDSSLKRSSQQDFWGDFCGQAVRAKILDPNFDILVDEKVRQGIREELQDDRENGHWANFADEAMALKLIDSLYGLKMDQEAWKGMRGELEKYKKDGDRGLNFAKLAGAMKILAAKKVEVTDEGLKITMSERKESIKPETPPIPEAKQF